MKDIESRQKAKQLVSDILNPSTSNIREKYGLEEGIEDHYSFTLDYLEASVYVHIITEEENIIEFVARTPLFEPINLQKEGINEIEILAETFCSEVPNIEPDSYRKNLKGGTVESDYITCGMKYNTTTEKMEWREIWE